MKARHLLVVVPILSLAACGPAAWTGYAEYIPAEKRSEETIASETIRELVADLPPDKVHESNQQSLAKHAEHAQVSEPGAIARLTLPAVDAAPQRDFEMIRHSNSRAPLLKMHVSRDSATAETHVFQRHGSYWHHWIQK